MMDFKIPRPLILEHEELHAELIRATRAGGKTGAAAKKVAKILHPHFEKEEEFALPPLGLLVFLAEGNLAPEMQAVLRLTDKLKANFSQVLDEHKAIVSALKELTEAAKKERKRGFERFSEKLILHARTEEEVLYPASILVGEYLKLKLGM